MKISVKGYIRRLANLLRVALKKFIADFRVRNCFARKIKGYINYALSPLIKIIGRVYSERIVVEKEIRDALEATANK